MSGIKIGEAATRLGMTTRTLRYYEEMGLLAPEERNRGGFRLYGEDEIKAIFEAEDELATLRREYYADPDDHGRREGILERALELNGRLRGLVDAKVAALQEMKTTLESRARGYKKTMKELRAGATR